MDRLAEDIRNIRMVIHFRVTNCDITGYINSELFVVKNSHHVHLFHVDETLASVTRGT
jgi:hypothetical protein